MKRAMLCAGVALLALTGCDDGGAPDADAGADGGIDRPAGWTEETHGKDAVPDYETVFPQGQVSRIDLVLTPDAWETMREDMTEMLGPFGALQGQPLVSPELIECCDGLGPLDECAFEYEEQTYSGVCMPYDATDELFCELLEGFGAPPENGVARGLLPWKPIYVPCEVRFEGKVWWHVGVRFKGNSTMTMPWSFGTHKLPMKLDFDEFELEHPAVTDQRFFGFKRLSLTNNARDPSYLRDKVGGDLFRAAGLPTPARAFYRVYVDHGAGPLYFGLYTVDEVPGPPLQDTYFGGSKGNLYKPEGPAATWSHFDPGSFPKKSNEDQADWSDVEAAIAALNEDQSDAATWRADLEAVFDVDGFLEWLAINTTIEDWDTYGYYCHNYYLYGDPNDGGRLKWIPWDHNESLKPAYYDLDLAAAGDNFPLIRRLIDDPVYAETYRAHVADFIAGPFALEQVLDRLQAEHELIEPYVTGEQGEAEAYTVLDAPSRFELELEFVEQHVAARHAAATEWLGGFE